MPVTEKEYEDAISLLKDCGEQTGDKDFETRKEQLEAELADYHDVRAVLVDATESFENEEYHDAFQTLEEGSKKYPESNKIKYAVFTFCLVQQFFKLITVIVVDCFFKQLYCTFIVFAFHEDFYLAVYLQHIRSLV